MTWPYVALGDLGQWFGGGTPSKFRTEYWDGGQIPWLSPKDMGPHVLAGTLDRVTTAAVATSSTKLVAAGSIAIVVRSGILERTLPVALVPFETTLNQDMKALVPRRDVEPRWVAWGLRAFERELLAQTRKRGTTVASIEMSRFQEFKLPIPSPSEQLRIVALLEDHLSRLEVADSLLTATGLRVAAWHRAFTSRAIWENENNRTEVRQLLREPMRNGRSDRAVRGSEPGTRTLTLTAVTRNDFTDEHTKLTTTSPERAASLWLEPGDIFVQRSNTPELVGTTARYDGPRGWAIFPDLLIRLRVDEGKMDGRFLTAALRSAEGHAQLRKRAKGLAGSMPKIDQTAIGDTLIPLPDLVDQMSVVRSLDAADEALRRVQIEVARARHRNASLRRALLAAAFSGQLVR